MAIGGAYSLTASRERKHDNTPTLVKQVKWMSMVVILTGAAAFFALINFHVSPLLMNAFWPFQIGVMYICMGIFIGRDMVLIGCWLLLSAAVSLLLSPVAQQVLFAIAGGGGLVLSGILLRGQAVKNERHI
jgi:hypothetical protein